MICSKNIDNTIIINNVKQHNKLNNSNNDSFQLQTIYTMLSARFILAPIVPTVSGHNQDWKDFSLKKS